MQGSEHHRRPARHLGAEERFEKDVRAAVAGGSALDLPVVLGRRLQLRQHLYDPTLYISVREVRHHKRLMVSCGRAGVLTATKLRHLPPLERQVGADLVNQSLTQRTENA